MLGVYDGSLGRGCKVVLFWEAVLRSGQLKQKNVAKSWMGGEKVWFVVGLELNIEYFFIAHINQSSGVVA